MNHPDRLPDAETPHLTARPVVRGYRDEDAAATLEIFIRAILQGARERYSPEQTEAWLGEEVRSTSWNRERRATDTVVAELDGDVVGFTDLSSDGYVDRLFTHPSALRRGVASALLTDILSRARSRGIARLTTHASEVARPVFERFGFEVVENEVVEKKGVQLRRYAMARDVTPMSLQMDGARTTL